MHCRKWRYFSGTTSIETLTRPPVPLRLKSNFTPSSFRRCANFLFTRAKLTSARVVALGITGGYVGNDGGYGTLIRVLVCGRVRNE